MSPIDSAQQTLSVETADGRSSINIDSLMIGSDVLQAGLSGMGMIAENGHLIGPTLSEWVSASFVRAGLSDS